MFTQPCFIRKNTPELRDELEKLGYRICYCCKFKDNIWLKNFLAIKNDPSIHGIGVWDIEDSQEEALNLYITENANHPNPAIDCDENEELFLALAALRDDTPINSYYWFNDNLFKCEGLEIDRVLKNNTANYLLKCRHVDNSMIISCFKERNMIKATVEEIIEHFKE